MMHIPKVQERKEKELDLSVKLFSAEALIGDTVNWKLKSKQMQVFEALEGKTGTPGKNFSEQSRLPQTQPTYDAVSENPTRATLVAGDRSSHCSQERQ